MLPAAIVSIAQLPLTPKGKLDRAALPAPVRANEVAAPTGVQARLAQIVASLLDGNYASDDDNFLRAGANPLLGALLIDRVRTVFGVTLTPDQIFESPTVSSLAVEIERASQLSTAM